MNTTLHLRGLNENQSVSAGNKAFDKFAVAFGAKVLDCRKVQSTNGKCVRRLSRSESCYKHTFGNLKFKGWIAQVQQ